MAEPVTHVQHRCSRKEPLFLRYLDSRTCLENTPGSYG